MKRSPCHPVTSMPTPPTAALAPHFRYWQRRVFIALWVGYAGFYLCRLNMAVALPDLMADLGLSKLNTGAIGSGFFFAYALGQFINGQLTDRFGARKLMPIGLFGSVICNLLFAATTPLVLLIGLWTVNGYFQSMGWSPSVKTLANWFPRTQRGKVVGLYGSSYHFGNVLTWILSGVLIAHWGWRYAFWIPALMLIGIGVFLCRGLRNAPEEMGLPPIERLAQTNRSTPAPNSHLDQPLGFRFTLRQTVGNPLTWRVGLAYLFLSVVVYGFLYWLPTYLSETRHLSIDLAASQSLILPISGACGALISGWATDRFFGSRRSPVVVVGLVPAIVTLFVYPHLALNSMLLNLLFLGILGFFLLGAQSTLVAAISMDLGTRKAAASVTGFIDGLGYVGATMTGIGTGWLVGLVGWTGVFISWAGCLVAALGIMLTLWYYLPSGKGFH